MSQAARVSAIINPDWSSPFVHVGRPSQSRPVRRWRTVARGLVPTFVPTRGGSSLAARACGRLWPQLRIRTGDGEDWLIDDLAGQDIHTIGRIVDDIDTGVRKCPMELTSSRP
jgi:hypothetical protein